MYKDFFKRLIDFILSLFAFLVLSPIFIIIAIINSFVVNGNPFFIQERPGKNEKIFKLIKFKSMKDSKDKDGNLLPDGDRYTKFGFILRKTSLDEIPELINIIKGDMAIVGPRPLLVSYLDLYTDEEKHRHDVRPGLTGLAQVNGRNFLTWEEVFAYDLEYIKNITLMNDIKIIFRTVKEVLSHEDVEDRSKVVNKDGQLIIEGSSGERRVHAPLDVERKHKNDK